MSFNVLISTSYATSAMLLESRTRLIGMIHFLRHFNDSLAGNFRTRPYLSEKVRSFIAVIAGALALALPTVLSVATFGKFHGGRLSDLPLLDVPERSFEVSLCLIWCVFD